MNPQRIQARVAARRDATAFVELLPEVPQHPAVVAYCDAYCEEIQKLLAAAKPPTPDQAPQPLPRLAKTLMPFGCYANKTFDEVPYGYLDWICRSQEKFLRDLQAYLKHPNNHRAQEEE